MDFKRVLRSCNSLTRPTKSRKDAKDTDSGISSTSSSDTADALELPLLATSDIKVETIAEVQSKTFSPVVVLVRSKETERLIQQSKQVYLQELKLCVPPDVLPENTDAGNETGKDLICAKNFREPHIIDASPRVNSNSPEVLPKYNLRRMDKVKLPKRFRDTPPPEKKIKVKPMNPNHPLVKREPVLNIKIVKHLSGEASEKPTVSFIPLAAEQQNTRNEILKPRRQKRGRPSKMRLNSEETRKLKMNTCRGKLWKRSDDIPSDVDCITSDHKIFRGAVLEAFSYKHLKAGIINIQKTSLSSDSEQETPEKVSSESNLWRTPEKKDTNSIITSTPPLIKITISTKCERQATKINASPECTHAPSPEELTHTKINCPVQDNITKKDNTETSNTVASDSESQTGPAPYRYTLNKLGSRLKRFDAAKLREDTDKPLNNICASRKRNSSNGDNSLSKRIKNADASNEINDIIVSPKKLISTSPARVAEKPAPMKIDESKSEVLEKACSSSNVLLYITPLASITDSKPLEIFLPQKTALSPKQLFKPTESVVRNNFLAAHAQIPNSHGEVHCSKPTRTTVDLRQRLNRQRSIFKTPLLPLIKRPPTRITAEVLSKLDQSKSVAKQNQKNQDFDVISLYADSLCEVNLGNESHLNDPFRINNEGRSPEADMVLYPEEEKEYQESPPPHLPAMEVLKVDTKYDGSKMTSLSSLDAPVVELPEVATKCTRSSVESRTTMSHKSHSEHTMSVENCKPTVQGIQEGDSSVFESPSSETTSVDKDTSKVSEWIASTTNEVVSIGKLNQILRNVCFHHNRYGRCKYYEVNKTCKFYHSAPTFFEKMIMDLTPEQFTYFYEYLMKKLPYLFTEVFAVLVDYRKDQEKALLDMVRDVIHVKNLEKTPYVNMIIFALKNLGLSFHIAVEEMFTVHGKEQWLVEILLDLVVVNQNCLENNWDLVQKLMNSLRHNLDQGVVSDIFNKCINTYPPNKKFCKNVYVDLIATDRLNLSHEPKNKIIKYINLLRSFCLSEYAEKIKDKYHIHLNNEPVNSTEHLENNDDDIKEPIFSNNSSNGDSADLLNTGNKTLNGVNQQNNTYLQNYFNDANKNNTTHANSYETYIPVIHEQTVPEYVPTQPFTAFNSHSQSYSYRIEDPVRQNSNEETNPKNTSNFFIGSTKNVINNVPNRTPSIKDDETVAFQHWESNKSTTSTDRKTENSLSDDVSNEDIIKLSNALKQSNISMILSLFAKYSPPNLSKSFVVHLIVALKQLNNPTMVEFFMKKIFCGFDSLCATMSLDLTHLLQLFGLNVLTYLDSYKKYEGANLILNKFPNEYSDFITTECIDNFEYLSTANFRYLFIFKILTRSGKFREALTFLKSLDLRVDESLLSDENPPKYLEYKKRLICEFMDGALKKSIPAVKDMLCFLIFEVRSCTCIDIERYLNYLIINMLNHYSEHKLELIGIFQIILNSWHKYLRKDVLRALFIQLYNDLPDYKILELYQISVRSKVYQAPEGNKNSVTFPLNLLKEEIYILLHLYFHNLSKNNFPVKNIIIDIKPENLIQEEPENVPISILINSWTNNTGMKNRILNILKKLPHPPANYSDSEHSIWLAVEDIRPLLDYYRSESLPPLQRVF